MLIQTLPCVLCCTSLLLFGVFTFAADDVPSQPSVSAEDDAAPETADTESQTDTTATDSAPSEPGETASANDDEPTPADESTPEDPAAARARLLEDEEWLNSPFVVLQREMQDAASDLEEGRTKPPAEMTQPLIVDRLDIMIEMLERSSGGGGGGNQNPTRPANASTLRTGPDRRGEMRAPQQEGRAWADLTEKERQKILQSKTDGFPPGYDDILADYFRRLSRGEAAPANSSADE